MSTDPSGRIAILQVAAQTEDSVSTLSIVDDTIDGCIVETIVRLPDTADTVVLLDPDHRPKGVLPWHPFPNVLRITPAGIVKWRAELLANETTAKCWVDLSYDGSLRVGTFSFRCQLDSETGRIISTVFDK